MFNSLQAECGLANMVIRVPLKIHINTSVLRFELRPDLPQLLFSDMQVHLSGAMFLVAHRHQVHQILVPLNPSLTAILHFF